MPPKKDAKSEKPSAGKEVRASDVWDELIASSKKEGKLLGYAGDNHIANMFEEQAEEKKDDFPTQVVVSVFCEPLLIKVLSRALVATAYDGLKQLRFWNCGFGDLGVKFLCEGLKKLPGVAHLEISDCLVGPKGCEYLGNVLQNITVARLKTLRLDHNNIGCEGATLLARGLSFNSYLTTLSLAHCNIGVKGAESLGKLCAVTQFAVTNLILESNEFGNEGIVNFCQGLKSNKSLTEIDLSLTCFGGESEAIDALTDALRTTPLLTYINIDGNLIGDAGLERMLRNLTEEPPVTHIQFIDVTPFLQPNMLALLHEYLEKNQPKKAGGKKKGKGKKKK